MAITAAAAMAVLAVPAYGKETARYPGFAAQWDTTYGQLRELTGKSMGDTIDPRTPWWADLYGGERDKYPLSDEEVRTLADGGKVDGVEHLAALDPIRDDETFGETQNDVARKKGKMIKGWMFTIISDGKHYHVFCYTNGKDLTCEILTPI